MDDARGMATKVLLDMLNIGGRDRGANVPALDDADKQGGDKDVEESLSDTTSITSSTLSPLRQTKTISEMSMPDGEITGLLDASTPRISLHAIKQTIQLTGDDRGGSVSVYGNQVEIMTSMTTSATTTASSKIKINPMVNYDWDLKYYRGNLIALGSKFIAYTLKGRSGYVIRLLNPETATRALIKGFIGLVTDLAFAHRNSNTLACVDEGGNLYVWHIREEDSKIEYNIKLHVSQSTSAVSEYHRIIWSPYLPEEEEEANEGGEGEEAEEDDRPLAITHHNQAEVIDIPMVIARCGCAEVTKEMLKQGEGFIAITDGHTKPITDGSLSPDGAVLATASEDGYVRFWQVSEMMPESTPSCLHEFQPHDGSTLSSLTFCDNHTVQEKDVPMWRFMITGAEYNREIKIWCTVTWTCIQTLRFSSPTTDIASVLCESYFVARLDATARYLVLSDIGRKVLYILLVHQDRDKGKAHISSITDFQLTQPLLSFIITKAKLFKLKNTENGAQENGDGEMNSDDVHDDGAEEILDESELESAEKRRNLIVQLRLYSIHTKSLQEFLIHFQPEASVPPPTPSNMSSMATSIGPGVRDALSDLSGMETGTEASTDIEESDGGRSDTSLPMRPKLITPDAFTHTPKATPRPESSGSSVTLVSGLNNSNPSIDELFASSVSSKLSESTLKSSIQESFQQTPQSSFVEDSLVLTPTSLPLPLTPLVQTAEKRVLSPTSLPLPATPQLHTPPDPSAVPIPTFRSSPFDMQIQAKEGEENFRAPNSIGSYLFSMPANVTEQETAVSEGYEKENVLSPTSSDDQENKGVEDKEKEPESLLTVNKEPIPSREVSRTESSGSEDVPTEDNIAHTEDADGRIYSEESETERTPRHAWSSNDQKQSLSEQTAIRTPHSHRPLIHSNLVASPVSTVDIPPGADVGNQESSLSISINELISLVRSQQKEMVTIREEMKENQSQYRQEMAGLVRGEVERLEDVMADRVQGSLAQHSLEENQRLEKALRERHTQDKKKQEQLTSTLSQAVTNSITGKLDKALKHEVKNNIVPTLQKMVTPVQEQLNTTMAQKLTAADAVMKDSISKMVKSKAVVEAIGGATATALQGPILATYREAFQNTILPAFERSCQSMFQQINDAFQKGTQQYLERVMVSVENIRRDEKEARDPILQQLQSHTQAFQAEAQRLRSTVTSDVEMVLQKQLATSLHGLREELLTQLEPQLASSLREAVQSEVRLGLQGYREQYVEVAEMGTEQEYEKIQRRITALLQEGNVVQAFQEALTAADLSIVVMVCESVDVTDLFSQSTPIAQPVLLSLIQQLSVDILTNTELKHRYLEEAVMALDSGDEVTREHMPTVLQGLCQQLRLAISHSTGPTLKSLRVLLMAAQSLLR